jgi:predicted nucleic acid-binding protein
VIVLDTAILVLAVGDDHPLRDPARRILEAHQSGRIECTTTVEVIQEFLHVRSRRRQRADAADLARRYGLAFDLVASRPEDLDRALELFVRHPHLGAFDAVLAAVALNRAAEALVSPDRAFGEVEGLRWVDPGGPELDALLA